MFATTRSRRLLAGGAALTAGVAVVAGPAVTSLAGADPVDGSDGATTPQALPDPSSFESCTAYFGLGKGNSDLVSYDVETHGPVTKVPVVGTDLIPVLTVHGAGGLTAQCIPEAGWTDQASFDGWFGFGEGLVPYPGTGYYLIPATYGWEATTPQGAFTPTSTSIEFLHELSGVTVSWSPTQPNAVENGFFIENSGPLPSDDPTLVTLGASITAVDADAAAGALAESLLSGGDCDDADPALPGLADALNTIFDTDEIEATCGGTAFATLIYYRTLLVERMIDESLVLVSVTAPTPTTTEPPTTQPPAAAAAEAAEVPPTFTG